MDDTDEGGVIVDGNSIPNMSDRKHTKFQATQMGFVFQSYNLMPVLSVVENVELPLLVSCVKFGKAREQAIRALDFSGPTR